MSGAYDYGDPDSLNSPSSINFKADVVNYVNSSDPVILHADSPVVLVDLTASPIKIVASVNDPMPPNQHVLMAAALAGAGLTNYQADLIPGNLHGFAYWSDVDDSVYSFLNDNL